MRILFFNESTVTKGGIDTVINSEINALGAKGIETRLLEISHKELLNKSYFDKTNLFLNRKKKIEIIRKQLESFKPNIIHIHNSYPFFRENIWSDSAFDNVKKVFHLHNFYPICPNSFFYTSGAICSDCLTNNGYSKAIKYACYDNSKLKTWLTTINRTKPREWLENSLKIDRYIAVSKFLFDKYLEFGLDRSKITEIPNGLEFDKSVIYDPNGSYVLFLGNIVLSKGIEIVFQLAVMNPEMKFVIAGVGRDLEFIKIKYRGLSNVEYVGFVENEVKVRLIKNSKLLLFPVQSWEAFGLAALESLICGKPVVTSGLGATSELIVDGENGIIVKSNKIEEYDRAIKKIWNVVMHYSNDTWQIHLEKYTLAKHVNSLVDLYHNVL
ncbi:MAG: hypothetical protein A2499_02960 [Stygiobacter sp. RIFOXYC12_FULL_38_8]|nr:MAG: hypothetical protein A2X62_09295 [Stygiobacter sp. GWC2_38_9]OGV06665.1 MAG: hypothetical protein A2299_01615 [Stygiobacter sp. RIFOXYB2_FULL_37_11]OGV11526.1 MAG: hypothetical protein A2237_05590 [Stygiobacter sp. RIFOXYA2_FULL_38_8]OGV15048.1 MAG: hypothetical protein A2440_06775 [Stygiobacter sp. RIFOXYC2_FULL_38_25]OGV22075.1 MAG: hypothetical protein A2499_02960 [Stygiobacter sp. RIFOXYC12_FULL_38_8]OGV79623.1 MAG: hypothetical protein A2X65_18860 [Stygiobacter sp. GWF2_38_21]RJQ